MLQRESRDIFQTVATLCRILFALTFIFSGFVKVVDPWGTAIKISEYLNAFGFENLKYARFGFSIWLCGAELMMGLMLLFRVRTPLISIFAVLAMLFFTTVTFITAMWLPVEDCGCFGDAVKLSNWETLAKNLVLLPMSIVIWWSVRKEKIFTVARWELVMTGLIMCVAFGLGIYCYRHLPLVDFLPYKVGTSLREAVSTDFEMEEGKTVLVYRNLQTGEEREFSLEDTEWQDESKWEWVDTRTEAVESDPVSDALLAEFSLHDAEGDATDDVLGYEGKTYMICVGDFADVKPAWESRLEALVNRATAEGARVVCLTPESLREVTYRRFGESEEVRCYNIDATTLMTMLRAKVGVVALDDGVIMDKRNVRDIDK